MSTTRIVRPSDFRRRRAPDPELIRYFIKLLNDLEPDDHLSDHPKFRGLRYVGIGEQGRDELVKLLTECAEYVERGFVASPMIGSGLYR